MQLAVPDDGPNPQVAGKASLALSPPEPGAGARRTESQRATRRLQFGEVEEPVEDEHAHGCSVHAVQDQPIGHYVVLTESNMLRGGWSMVVVFLLGYTATIYLYRFSFCAFHININGAQPIGEDDVFFEVIDTVMDVIFWADLIANFFFSYRNERGMEVVSMRLIAWKYLTFYFWINLVACCPEELGNLIITAFMTRDSHVDFRVARITRLQRISRLARLMRLTRLAKCIQMGRSTNPFWGWFQSLRGVRIVNFIGGLVWSVHFLACGWYLTAAFHGEVQNTWVARRTVNFEGRTLLEQGPFEQWLHSMYFVLTVFTTVGFGDMSAFTEAEIVYVALTMVVGAVVHSIIISEVITIVTSTDRTQEFIDKQLRLVEAFAEHVSLSHETHQEMEAEIKWRAKSWVVHNGFNKAEMRQLITGKYLPRWLIGSLPPNMFEGRLIKNLFLRACYGIGQMPPRLPCLLAVHLQEVVFEQSEIVYQMTDFPFNLFLVMKGTLAHIGLASPQGGQDDVPADNPRADNSNHRTNSAPLFHADSKASNWVVSPFTKIMGLSNGMRQAAGSTKNCSSSQELQAAGGAAQQLVPYRLCSHGSYFGDTEMIMCRARFSTVRCESASATTLVLHKNDFAGVQEEFPQFAAAWTAASRRREWSRMQQLTRLTRGRSYEKLAAWQIQRAWRLHKVKRSQALARGDISEPVRVNSKDFAGATTRHYLRVQGMQLMENGMRGPGAARSDGAAGGAALSGELSDIRATVEDLRQSVEAMRQDLGFLRVEARESRAKASGSWV